VIFQRHFLRPQMLFHGERIVGAALDRRIIGNDHTSHPADLTDASDDTGGGNPILINRMGGKGGKLEKRRTRINQRLHPLARQHLATGHMFCPRHRATALGNRSGFFTQISDQISHRGSVGQKFRIVDIEG
jgi:hypothetical protein